MDRRLLARVRKLLHSRGLSFRTDDGAHRGRARRPAAGTDKPRRMPPPIPSDAIIELDSGFFTIDVAPLGKGH